MGKTFNTNMSNSYKERPKKSFFLNYNSYEIINGFENLIPNDILKIILIKCLLVINT